MFPMVNGFYRGQKFIVYFFLFSIHSYRKKYGLICCYYYIFTIISTKKTPFHQKAGKN